MTTLSARWLFPVTGPPIEGGSVTFSDRILSLGRGGTDLGECALVPAFVNAHCHLDLTGMAGLAPPSPDFTGWLRKVIAHRRGRDTEGDIKEGIRQLLESGTALVGDISGDGASWPLLQASPLRAVVFREALGLPPERAATAIATMESWRGDEGRCRRGVSPHAPYSCHRDVFRAAARTGLPLATHLAETLEELRLLERREGPFVEFLRSVGVWHPEGLPSSVEEVLGLIATDAPVLLAHCNYWSGPLPANVSIVYCPRTHAAFGHRPHPLPEGVRIALGTDGLASNPDLSVFHEARFLYGKGMDPARVLRMATLDGAEALGEKSGALEIGRPADVAVVRLGPGHDPWERLFGGAVVGLWIAGEEVRTGSGRARRSPPSAD